MSRSLDEITRVVLRLTDEERAELASTILRSLDDCSDSDVEDAWRLEVARREDQLHNGDAELVPGDEVFARVRRRLGA